MPKTYRLTVADLKAFRPERRFAGTLFTLAIGPAARTGLACVVSKKVAVHAVDRNKIKRRAKAVLAPLASSLSPAAYVLYGKSGVADAAFLEVKRDIEKLLARV